jgi:predicted CoA-substrate-specific enzyme activase
VSAAAIGVDAGSATCKAVAIDGGGRILARRLEPAHPRVDEQAARFIAELRAEAGGDPPVGATGYGRKRVPGALALTEITCHARGAHALIGRPGLVIDIGGQDTKLIRVGPGGEVLDFTMNDRCAAGTGRFLEVILARLDIELSRVAEVVRRAARAVPISSTCTVFAETEVVSMVAGGEAVEAIVKGIHAALAARVAAMAHLGPDGEIFFCGGVALNAAMVAALAEAVRRPVQVVPDPQLVGALGAALSVSGSGRP